MATSRNGATHRLYLLVGFLLFWCLVICLRLVYLQVFRYGDFQQRAEHQQQRSINVSAKRGIVYDRQGRELAMSILVDSAFAVPSEVPDLPNAVSLITRITGEDGRLVLADCRAHKTFCWIARKANAETIDRIRALNLQGIHFQKESKRFYPKRDLAAQVLGYVGTDDGGLSGIEREYDEQLKGQPGRMQISVDARRKWFARIEKEPEAGQNLVLTIDEKIQYIAERELEQALKDTHAIAGTVIVENPHTGEILALANRPTFNPNVRKEIRNEALKTAPLATSTSPVPLLNWLRFPARWKRNSLGRKKSSTARWVRSSLTACEFAKQATRTAVGFGCARGVERRGRDQDCTSARRGPFLQVHSRFRVWPADRNRVAG